MPERWPQIERIYGAVVARPESEWATVLTELCAGDESLRHEVESLLAHEEAAGSFLETPAFAGADVAGHLASERRLVGQRFGSFTVLEPIGSGGMGEVYRARDERLGRQVAIKLLPSHFASDPEHRARLQSEARTLAALNHPHIGAIYGLEDVYGCPALVLELVEGETLAEHVAKGPLPLAQALVIARQIADALDAAHRKGIIHRDLKPANVKVTPDGVVKVLDFGLAKAVAGDGSTSDLTQSPTMTVGKTREGMILGTAAYMSPEQARGKPVDTRTDIWAFGCVLYEMLTGRGPFALETITDTLAAIIERDPEWKALPPATPASIIRLLRDCLVKDPTRRLDDIANARIAINEAPSSAPLPAERAASIAVLAFADMSAAKDQDWFCDGVAEEIINALTPLNGLRVAARASAFSFKGKGDDLRTIGRKLNVTTVLDGSVRRSGDRVRITVQLNDVADGFQLWSERYDRELKDIFDVQDEIAKAIAERLRVTLAGGKDERLVEQATTSMDAYQLYLRGRALLDRRGATVAAGLDLLRKAVEVDPGYSLAWAGLADAFTVMAYSGAGRGSESKSQAIAAATRAIELNPASAAGHTALAAATLLYENRRATAKREFERALALNPSNGVSRSWYALFYFQWARGEFESGVAENRRALESDPLSAYVMTNLGCCLFTAGRLDEAIHTCRQAVQLDPDSFVARWALGVSLGLANRFDEAVSTLEAAAGMSNRHSLALTALAGVWGQAGKVAEARALHRELMDRVSRIYVSPTHLALTAESAGEREEAMAFSRRAWDEREPSFILWARHFPPYRTLHSDPRFGAILREMNAPEEDEERQS
ncbi:MAG TPA: protein kinase [Vicinamibacterales bacterium]